MDYIKDCKERAKRRSENGGRRPEVGELLLAVGVIAAILASAGIYAGLLWWNPVEWVWNVVMAPVGIGWVLGIFRYNDEVCDGNN